MSIPPCLPAASKDPQGSPIPAPPAAPWGRVGLSTYNVGTHGAESGRATGEQVAAVEWQEDLDVVLAVTL